MDTEGFQADLGPSEGRASAGPPPPRGLLDVLAVAAVVLDASGRIVLWSPQAEQLLGYTPGRHSASTRPGCWWPRRTSTACSSCSPG